MIEIDGSMGEGGGQILRTALALSIVTRTPFRIASIRGGRARPGLMRQHLTAVRAAAAISDAEVEGDEVGSDALSFRPGGGPVRGGEHVFAVGTAGSTTLVLQAVLPAFLRADRVEDAGDGSVRIEITGGTHNPHAPTGDFLMRSFAPAVRAIGMGLDIEVVRPGFFPAGGGRLRVELTPAREVRPLELIDRGAPRERRAVATVAGIAPGVAFRELKVLRTRLGWPEDAMRIEQLADGVGPGNVVSVEIASEHVVETITSFGMRSVRAEAVAEKAAEAARSYLTHDAPVGAHLADQLPVPMVASGAGGAFRTAGLTPHAETNLQVIERFTGVPARVQRNGDGTTTVTIAPW